MLYKIEGVIEFNPINMTKKHQTQSEWKKVVMVRLNCDIDLYYSWFLENRFSIKLNRSIRKAHVTFISEIIDDATFDNARELYDGKKITLYYEVEPKTNGKHWWIRVFSEDIDNIRLSMGIEKYSYFGMHLTLGYATDRNVDHSLYIADMCNEYGLLSYDKRKEFNQYKIL